MRNQANGRLSLSLALASALLALTASQSSQAAAWITTGSMLALRYFHTATLLTNGQVLVVGGKDPPTQEPLASAELYDPATGVFA